MRRCVLLFLLLAFISACDGCKPAAETKSPPAAPQKKELPFISFSGKSPAELKKYHGILHTSEGPIEISFLPEVAPEHVRNFLKLSQAGFYDRTAWHRVVRNFVIQGGDLATRNPPLQQAEIASGVRRLQPEFSQLKHVAGTMGMAHGKELDSAETSFYICLKPQPALDNKFTIFGKVYQGMETVEKISQVSVGKGGRPRQLVELDRAEIVEADNQSEKK